MITTIRMAALGVAATLAMTGAAQAALIDRGGGLIYDDVLDVTWLQDANYAQTSGYDADGLMDGNAAKTWAANLVYHDIVRNVDWSDWRLSSVEPINGTSFTYVSSYAGDSDVGYNISAPNTLYPGTTASELAFMHFVNLGNPAAINPYGVPGCGACLFNVGPFINLQHALYWSGTPYEEPEKYNRVWAFQTQSGYQAGFYWYDPDFGYAWAVRDGDVAAVPEAQTYALMLAGLGLIGWRARRRG